MRTDDLKVGRNYSVVLPYEGARGVVELVDTAAVAEPDDHPYPGHAADESLSVRVLWVSGPERMRGRRQRIRPNDIVRRLTTQETAELLRERPPLKPHAIRARALARRAAGE